MSLYELEREKDTEGIAEVLRDSDKEAVRKRAAEILGRIPESAGREIVKGLVEGATKDSSRSVRIAAVGSLKKLDEKNGLANVVSDDGADDVVPLAVEGKRSDERAVRAASILLLGAADGKRAVEALVDAADDPDKQVREVAARTIKETDHPAAVEALISMSDDPSPKVRETVADAVAEHAEFGDSEEVVLELSEDKNGSVRRAAASSLGSFGTERAVRREAEMLGDGYEPVRLSAAFSIVESLSNAPTERSHEIRKSAAKATEKCAVGERTAEALADVLGADERAARRNAAWLLGRVSQPTGGIVNSLIEALGDEDETTARFAANSLAETGGSKAEKAVIEATEVEDTREMAVFALGELGGEKAGKVLSNLVDGTESDTVREKAFSALSKLDDPETHI